MIKSNAILVFGAGDLQLSLIDSIKKKGLVSVAIDPNPNAPGKCYADFFYQIAPDDFEQTLYCARKHAVVGVATTATDHPIVMMARIAEKISVPFPSVHSVITVLDKFKLKSALQNANVLCAKGAVYSTHQTVDVNAFCFPVIIKPNEGSGSRGVMVCRNPGELHEAISHIREFLTDERYIIEEYIPGEEFSVEALVQNGKLTIIQITDYLDNKPPYNVPLGRFQPSKYVAARTKVEDILKEVIQVTGLDNCAIHPEFKIFNNKLYLIEIGPRLGGGFITSHLVPLSTCIDLESLYLDVVTNREVFIPPAKIQYSSIRYLSLPIGSKVKRVIPESELKLAFPRLVKYKQNLQVGDTAKQITSNLDTHGYWIVYDHDRDELYRTLISIENYVVSSLLSN